VVKTSEKRCVFVTNNEHELLEKNKQLEAQNAQLLHTINHLKKEKEALQFTLSKVKRVNRALMIKNVICLI